MRVRVQTIGAGNYPHGVVVELITVTGPQRLVVEDSEVKTGSLSVGYPLSRDNELVLVALPRETDCGSFRVWVRTDDVLSS